MFIVLCNIAGELALNFIDDILLFAKDPDEMFLRLNIVFDRLELANLMAGFNKVKLLRREVVFLGFLVDQHGVRSDPEKITAFAAMERPQSYYEIKRLVGLLHFHAKLIPHISIRMRPIARLLEGTKSLPGRKPTSAGQLAHNDLGEAWGDEQDAAFADLKQAIVTATLVAHPEADGLFVQNTDASGIGLGATLQ
jgi:hypothetical protein